MHGDAINKEIGKNGFGCRSTIYSKNFSKTLGELDFEVKQKFSHRNKALNLAKKSFRCDFIGI